MKLWRWIAGPEPALRLIALLLAIIAILLVLLLREAKAIVKATSENCSYYYPCEVEVVDRR